MYRYRVVLINQVNRNCEPSQKYLVQKRKWFSWTTIAEFKNNERTEALLLLDALDKLPKKTVIGVV
ncbi:MAG: hypothetical protein [Caudoviricetes sp.]|jgi:hypothetical protein|nr:MAG: hypothetical protein [Caudoviricetes sp.]